MQATKNSRKVLLLSLVIAVALGTASFVGYRYIQLSQSYKQVCDPSQQTQIFSSDLVPGQPTPKITLKPYRNYWINGYNQRQLNGGIFDSLSFPQIYYTQDFNIENITFSEMGYISASTDERIPLYKSENWYRLEIPAGDWQFYSGNLNTVSRQINDSVKIVSCPTVRLFEF